MARRPAPPPPRRPSFARGVATALLANPTSTAGGLVMTAMAAAILTNALALQSGRHPYPLFQGTRPVAAPAGGAADAPRETLNLRDRAMVAEIQLALKTRGYYTGDVDGLPGPMTTGAITAFEKASGLSPTGTPSEDLLDRLKGGTGPRSATEEPVLPAAPPRDLADLIDGASIPVPTPSPLRRVAAAAPAADPETTAALPAAPVPTEAIRTPPDATVRAPAPAPAEPAAVNAVPDEMPAPTPAVVRPADPPTVKAAPVPPAASPVAADPRIARIQEALDRLGYGPLKADGIMTRATREAIRRFEESRNLPPTGAINERFLKELIRIGGLAQR